MNGSDWFTVGVRLIGVWYLAQSAVYVITFLDVYLEITPLQAGVKTPFVYLFYAFGNALITLSLLLGARLLAHSCFNQDVTKNPRFMDDGEDDFSKPFHPRDSSTP